MKYLRANNFYFVLVRPMYPGNIGSSARVIKNFGFTNLVLISPLCDISNEAYILAVHARDVLEKSKIYVSIDSFIREERINYVIGTTARLGGDKNPKRNAILSNSIRGIRIPNGNVAILFGNEETGLTNNELEMVDLLVTIPTSELYSSLNLSHAVAIIAYELSLLLKTARKLPYRCSTKQERGILIQYLKEIANIVLIDLDDSKRRIYEEILTNWVNRAFLTGREVHSLIGFVRRVLAKLKDLRFKKYG